VVEKESTGAGGGPTTEPPGRAPDGTALGLGDAWVIVELAPDAVLVVDERGRIDLSNRAAEEMFGYGRDSLTGMSVDVLVPDGLRHVHRGHRAAFAATPQTRPMGMGLDLWARRADGSEFPVQISLSPVTFGQGPRVVAIVREVTEHRQSERDALERLILADEERIGTVLQDRVVTRLFGAGLVVDAVIGRVSPEIAGRLREVATELDAAIYELREAVFGWSGGP